MSAREGEGLCVPSELSSSSPAASKECCPTDSLVLKIKAGLGKIVHQEEVLVMRGVLTVKDQVMGTSPVSSDAIASKAPVERSREADEEHPGHLPSANSFVRRPQGKKGQRETDSSATVAVTLLPLLVLVIVTVLPQEAPEPYISVCSATIWSESLCVVPHAPGLPSSARGEHRVSYLPTRLKVQF